jgi:hypothetical protein
MLIFMTNLQKPAIIGHPDLLVGEYAFIPKVTIFCRLKKSYFSFVGFPVYLVCCCFLLSIFSQTDKVNVDIHISYKIENLM